MKLSQFKYHLPQEQIALYPTAERDEARLMVLHRKTQTIVAAFRREGKNRS